MKLEWKKLTVDIEGIGHVARHLNTPTGVVLTGGQSGGHFTVDGCNITDEGEFVPAPGFANLAMEKVGNVAAEKLARVAIYVYDVLSSSQTLNGSQLTASKILEILRGDG